MKKYALALAPLMLVACAGPERAPSSLVELYDMTAHDGAMEIEFDRDGNFLEIEADVPVETVPESLRRITRLAHPDAVVTGAEREVQGDTWTWEIKFTSGGRAMEIVLDEQGNVLETERELERDEAPSEVLEASRRAIPDSSFLSVEVIKSEDALTYHVKRQRGGARYKIVLSANGVVLRKVRETTAEIEIPLAD